MEFFSGATSRVRVPYAVFYLVVVLTNETSLAVVSMRHGGSGVGGAARA